MSLLSARLRHPSGLRDQGMALIMTLWTLTALAAMVAPLAVGARQNGLRTLRAVEDVALRAAIDGALARALAEIDAGRPALGRERRWRLGGVELRYTVSGESGRVDLNAASPQVLDALFAAHGLDGPQAEELRDRLLARRSRRAPEVAAGGGSGEALDAEVGGPLRHPAELRPVAAGVAASDATLYERLWNDLTVWTAAPSPVPRLARNPLRERLAGLGGGPRRSTAGIAPLEIGDADPGGVYRVDIRAELPAGAARRTLVVVAKEDDGWRTREWMTPLAFEDGRDE